MNPVAKGSFHLRPGVDLIPSGKGGIIFKARPLRALKVNAAAFGLLQKCRDGLSLEEGGLGTSIAAKSTLDVFDRLCQTGILEWRPPPEAYQPFVSIVVAVYNRAEEIGACIESLLDLDYPSSKCEIIVVDDGSTDGTAAVVSKYDVRLVGLERNVGQSAARNAGVVEAEGEIVAFVDSDCIAESGWLRELVPYFEDSRNALVGGYVASFYRETLLDRYEEAKSPLNMGEDVVTGSGEKSDFYVPTCNMLVRRNAYLQVGGLSENLRVGEDVDFCWRLKEEGFRLVYVPKGRVRHKHRNRFWETFKRRFDYGTSEPVLYSRHQAVSKHYPWQPLCMGVFFLCALGLLLRQPVFAPMAALLFLWDVIAKKRLYEREIGISLTFGMVFRATVDRHFELLYYLSAHIVRYYLVLMIPLAFLFTPIIPVLAALVLIPSISEFFRRKPRLSFPIFLTFYLAEQASYQTGVFRGCTNQKSFRTYRLVFTKPGKPDRTGFFSKLRAIFKTPSNSSAMAMRGQRSDNG
jgi:mycofactocin system glycosyltransferase